MGTLTLQLISKVEERINDLDKLIHIYEYRWFASIDEYADRYDLGTLERLRNEKNFLLDLLKEIK